MLDLIGNLQVLIAEQIYSEYEVGVEKDSIQIEVPQNEKFGDYSTNIAMVLAKTLKQSPFEIAKNLSYGLDKKIMTERDNLKKESPFSKVQAVAPGFINFYLSDGWLLNLFKLVYSENESYGTSPVTTKYSIALEHSNVNPNKAPHVGHLRNAVVGQFIEKIYEFLGHNVSVQYYSNDVGVQVATSYLGANFLSNLDPKSYERFDYYAWDVYSQISRLLENDDTLKAELEELLKKIENPDLEISKAVASFADKILKDQIETFNGLGITYDVIIHERDIIYTKMWESCFEILKQNPNFYLATEGKSKGCWLLKNSTENSNADSDYEKDKIIVRSNGIPTYTGKDIAYHMFKYGLLGKDFGYKESDIQTQHNTLYETTSNRVLDQKISFSNADKVIDVIDQKQTYAISAVKQSLKVLGYVEQAANMHHVNYGFVYLSPKTAKELGVDISDGATKYEMSGRKGLGIKILDFISIVDAHISKEYGDFAAKDHVRNAAIKFELLKYNTFNDMVFDLDTALNTKGFSGPYIQYTHARICSIMSKVDSLVLEQCDFSKILDPSASVILRTISKFDEVVLRSAIEFAPNLLCEYLFTLAKLFNAYYNDYSILGADNEDLKKFRLNVAFCTKIVLRNGLNLLGIVAPEKI
jgi:arginyl-tRNA synthetase